MPMYRYQCNTCDQTFSVLELANDPPTSVCNCEKKSKKIERVIGIPSISFKGKGFYVSDKKSTSKTKTAAKENGAAKKKDKKSDKSDKSGKSGTEKKSTSSKKVTS